MIVTRLNNILAREENNMIGLFLWFLLNLIFGMKLITWLMLDPFVSIATIVITAFACELWITYDYTLKEFKSMLPIAGYLLLAAYLADAASYNIIFIYPLEGLSIVGFMCLCYIIKTADSPNDIKQKIKGIKVW